MQAKHGSIMEPKLQTSEEHRRRGNRCWSLCKLVGFVFLLNFFLYFLHLDPRPTTVISWLHGDVSLEPKQPRFEQLPRPGDPFQFIPCTADTKLPDLHDKNHKRTWANLFDPNWENYSWGIHDSSRPQGIFLCGYIDVPFDYKNKSEERTFRLAVTKYQVSGLKCRGETVSSAAGEKSKRTIILEPGGPGGSGTFSAWKTAVNVTQRYSDGQFDVLGWDPRGVNLTLPQWSCFPSNSHQDRWRLLVDRLPEMNDSPRTQLEEADAMNDANFRACKERAGDIPQFVSTALVVRDLDQIREALGEDELTAYVVSYGTTVGQTYANMFPGKVGRMVLDGVCDAMEDRKFSGFATSALGNITDAWHDGVLGECVAAGPSRCELAKPIKGEVVTVSDLEKRMDNLLASLKKRPMAAYLPSDGPSLVTYTDIMRSIFTSLYNPTRWPALAAALADLEQGNTTLAAQLVALSWTFDPENPSKPSVPDYHNLMAMVVCSDGYDAPRSSNLDWWVDEWEAMYAQEKIGSSQNFYYSFVCQNFLKYWPNVAEVYRGTFNNSLKNPVLLVSQTHDPATPLHNAKRLHSEMGKNARLVIHHGYGHSSVDRSDCTDAIARNVILKGVFPTDLETECYANSKPYSEDAKKEDLVEAWRENIQSSGVGIR